MTIYFVGAGPGDPELITLKAQRILNTTHCCVWAGSLINPQILTHLPTHASIHDSATLHLEQIVSIMVDAHKRGETVTRLHTGDLSLYSAAAEQMALLHKRGISFEVVPGVSAFQGAAARLQMELTAPDVTQSVVLTRIPGRTPMPSCEKLETFAKTKSTLCIYLSIQNMGDVAARLTPFYGADCPVAVVYRATWPDERIVHGTLTTIAARVTDAEITRTAIIMVGRALSQTGAASKLYDATFSHEFRKGNL